MKNINIVKIIGVIAIIAILAGMFFILCGFAQYSTEEVEADISPLIEELEYEGFVQSTEDENIWTIMISSDEDFDIDGYATAYARFDTDENIGVVTIVGQWTEDGIEYTYQTYIVKWNFESEDFDTIGEFEY